MDKNYGFGNLCSENEVPAHLAEWPDHIPKTSVRKFFTDESDSDKWFASEYYDTEENLLSRSVHVFIKQGLQSTGQQGEF
jgi:hypothetical protein